MAIGTTALAATAVGLAAAGTGLAAYSSIAGGHAQAKQARYEGAYNAEVYKQQADVIEQQKKVDAFQRNREIARVRGSVVAKTAGSGLMLSGSPLAIMVDNESLMRYDKAISQYNLEVKRRYALSGSQYYGYMGEQTAKSSVTAGYTNAFSSILSGGTNIALLSMPIKGTKA